MLPPEEDGRTRALLWYVAVLAGLFQVAWLTAWIQSTLMHRGYPADSLFFDPSYRFTDFTIYLRRFQQWWGGADFFAAKGHPFTYPAPCFYAFAWITRMPFPLLSYLAAVVSAAVAGALLIIGAGGRRSAVAATTVATLFLSYPFLHLLDRANIEGLVWILLLGGLLCFLRNRLYWAAALIGLATALKIFPALLLLPILSRRRYREFAFGVGVAVATTVGATATLGVAPVASGLEFFRQSYALQVRVNEIGFDHSLFCVVKHVLRGFGAEGWLPRLATPYAALTLGGFAALYWFRLKQMPLLNQWFGCTAAMVTLPYVSYDYTLVHLYLPWGVLVLSSGLATGRMLRFLIPCAVLFSPESWIYFNGAGAGGVVKAAALVSLLWASVKCPLQSDQFHGAPE